MRAIHAGLRRDAARLESLAPQLERRGGVPADVPKGWATFRQTLHVHHAAEDDDLWPVLRSHLTGEEDIHQLDLMVEESGASSPCSNDTCPGASGESSC